VCHETARERGLATCPHMLTAEAKKMKSLNGVLSAGVPVGVHSKNDYVPGNVFHNVVLLDIYTE